MSSGEKAKPPAFEERNPFDISRRSGTEVATEIAKRMAAWKQARGRSHAASSTVPGSAAEPREAKSPEIKAPEAKSPETKSREAKATPLAAPVQPVRQPSPQQAAADPRKPACDDRARGGKPRAPYFATFSIQRAMPPAPSPKRVEAQPQPTPPEAHAASAEPTVTAVAPPPEFLADSSQESIVAAAAQAPVAEAQPAEAVAQEPVVAEADASSGVVDSPAIEERRIDPPVAEPAPTAHDDEIERRRAKARDIKARWMAAHDVEVPATVTPTLAAEVAAPAADARDGDEGSTEALPVAAAMPSLEALEDLSGRREPTFAKEPAFAGAVTDSPAAMAEDQPVDAPEPAPVAPTIETADEPAAASAAQEQRRPEQSPEESVDVAPDLPPIEELDAMSGRKEPTFDAPIRTKEPASPDAPTASTRAQIELPAMQTRIEARRITTLRAEPHPTVRRPIFPHIEPEQWDITSPIPMSAQRVRHGTGWAIGLGAVLLLIGVTAPAALWQQGRQSQDDVATAPVTVAPDPANPTPPQQAAPQQAAQQPASQSPAAPQQAASTAPQQEPAPPRAPDATDQSTQTAGLPSPVLRSGAKEAAPNQAAPQPAPEQATQTTLGPIRNKSELEEATVLAPPPPSQPAVQGPTVNLASQTGMEASSSAMVAKPFVPEAGPPPFLRAPTVGVASVPVDGGANSGTKPALIGQLKPKAQPGAKPVSKPAPTYTREPRPFFDQTPEQMFQTLIDTLGQGKQANPALKPPPPSTRK